MAAVQAGNAPHQYNIKPANVYHVSNNRSEPLLTIFCWTGDPKTVFGLWKTATVSSNMAAWNSIKIKHTIINPMVCTRCI